MASRSSPFHLSLQRPLLIMGIEKASFGGLVFAASFCLVAHSYWGVPVIVGLYFVARWLTKHDAQFLAVFLKYLNEEHIFDATPRIQDMKSRPKGWGKGLPL